MIVLHAGSEHGWIPNCELVFRGKSGTARGLYHNEMNTTHFMDWFIPVNFFSTVHPSQPLYLTMPSITTLSWTKSQPNRPPRNTW